MTEIDRIPRLKLSDLRKLIQNANLIADAGRKLFNEGRLSEKKEQQLRDLFQKQANVVLNWGNLHHTPSDSRQRNSGVRGLCVFMDDGGRAQGYSKGLAHFGG